MKKFFGLLMLMAGLWLGWAQSVQAHVSFTDLGTDPTTRVSHTLTQYRAYGWIDGTDADLGDSHNIGGLSARWYRFTLTQPSLVDISFIQNTEGLDPAFTLYRGAFAPGAHDWADYDIVQPVDDDFNLIASPTDSDPNGQYLKHSGYRDTLNNTYEGQFDAFGDWSMANFAGESGWVKLQYVIAVGATSDSDLTRGLTWGGNGNHSTGVGTGESLLNYFLPAGIYSIAAGGERCNTSATSCTSPFYSGTVSLTAQAVPVPAAVWLFGSALGGLGLIRRRRCVAI